MSHEASQSELQAKTQRLLQGPLKHIKAAALAAALLPLASVAATPASAQSTCLDASGGVAVCGTAFNDGNNNGIQDSGELGIESVKVFLCQLCDNSDGDQLLLETGPDGTYSIVLNSTPYNPELPITVLALIPTGSQASPPNIGDDMTDSDGVPNGAGYSVSTVTGVFDEVTSTVSVTPVDFGFYTPSIQQPGTGTPGYWKNHPEAWPVATITIGGVTYTKAQAISWLGKVGKDKTTTMFASLVSAKLNLIIGNDGSCVSPTIAAADSWMATYGPVGKNVAAGSTAWRIGEPFHITMDNYNNGLLCAPHRD